MFAEYAQKLQSVEAQCKILEKQFSHMRKMVETGNKERKAVIEKQVFWESATRKKCQSQILTMLVITGVECKVMVDWSLSKWTIVKREIP